MNYVSFNFMACSFMKFSYMSWFVVLWLVGSNYVESSYFVCLSLFSLSGPIWDMEDHSHQGSFSLCKLIGV